MNDIRMARAPQVLKLHLIATLVALASCQNPENSGSTANRTESTMRGDPKAEFVDPVNQCDTLASDPHDPQRNAPGVAYEAMVPSRALEACRAALASSSAELAKVGVEARLNFQLARALIAMGQPDNAFLPLTRAAELGSVAAMKSLGDAFYEGRGLPIGIDADLTQAVSWYEQAYSGGYTDALELLGNAKAELVKSTLDPEKFSRPDFIRALYERDISKIEAPLALAYYTKGLIANLDSNEAIFLDPACKVMIGRFGSQVLSLANIGAVFAQFQNGSSGASDGEKILGNIAKLFIQEATRDYWTDQGSRDATVLFNKEVYGCDSPVAKKIVSNVMITSNGNTAL